MDENSYISSVKEQLRAYDFDERDIYPLRLISKPSFYDTEEVGVDSKACFYKREKKLTRVIEQVVFIFTVDEPEVQAVKDAISDCVGFFDWSSSTGITSRDQRWVYPLLIPTEVTKAMRIAAKREAGQHDSEFVLPVIADPQNNQLIYDNPSKTGQLTAHGTVANNAENYFVI
ncbi:hypothetical protein [Haloprofundus marisrubri]|uniref:hypothetical protein n=1 Tax=Haloprofundus marisrubri TaxID=1514971 RepID=UPI0012BABA81|nr:hypothetical protein [Haloprofundus marisrubri]